MNTRRAAMSEQQYTPDTETVREQYTREQPPHIGTVASKSAEFDRWLAGVKADAWNKGFTRGFYDVLAGGDRDASESPAPNPYEEDRHVDR